MTSSTSYLTDSSAAAPRVSFVVLNWRNADATRACVQSIVGQDPAVPREIIVVDNESCVESRAALGDGPWRLVCLQGNQGFTGGMNAGAARATGEFIALINNDARLSDEWLGTALQAAADPHVGIVGGSSLGEDGSAGSTLPRVDPRGFSQLLTTDVRRASVASVDGGHLLIRTAAWRELGGFDADFFAYYEEVDLSARALACGWQVLYEPALRIWHRRGLSSDRVRWRRLYWARRNRMIWIAKHFPAAEWRQAVAAAALGYLSEAWRGPAVSGAPWAARWLERSAPVAAFLWAITHARWLARKRQAGIDGGQHDPGYRALIARLYQPAPFAPELLGPTERL